MAVERSDDQFVFILELTKQELRLIGQLLHLHLASEGEHPIGVKALQSLYEQTDCVHKKAKDHGVYPDGSSLSAIQESEPVWHKPYDQ
jgi:hypothetical protein